MGEGAGKRARAEKNTALEAEAAIRAEEEKKAAKKAAVKACKRYIESHLFEKITTQSLADSYRYSSRTLWRYFKDVGPYSAPQYVRLRRVHMAARYLRHGSSVNEAFEASNFNSKSAFVEAFVDYYGISPWEFAKTRGMALMKEPEIVRRDDFHIVGYMFIGQELVDWENSGAYYITQDFPEVSPREWERIGGGADMVGTWMEKDGSHYYIFGPGVREVQYIPKPLGTLYVPGGLFAAFPVDTPEDYSDTTVLCENVQVTWYYALRQWMPDSDYLVDESRIPYEFYLDGNATLYVPVVPKIRKKLKVRVKVKKKTE